MAKKKRWYHYHRGLAARKLDKYPRSMVNIFMPPTGLHVVEPTPPRSDTVPMERNVLTSKGNKKNYGQVTIQEMVASYHWLFS